MNSNKRAILAQITPLLKFYTDKRLGAHLPLDILGDSTFHSQFNMRALATIERISGPNGPYAQQAKVRIKQFGLDDFHTSSGIKGILESLKNDISKGYLASLEELIHASMFSDYLEMADHLIKESYKDAAAVIAGSTLEEHLRKLCLKNNVPIHTQKAQGSEPKKASMLNAELYKANVYSNAQQQQITAWLAIRNNAAHGEYAQYTLPEVKLLIQGVRDFIIRLPA